MNTITKFLSLEGGVMSTKLSSKLSCADTRILKGIRTVATGLCSMLPLCVVLVSQPAQAGDFTASSASNTNVAITSNINWTTIRSAFVAAQPHAHSCQITAGGDVFNPGGGLVDQQYVFTVTIDDSNPITDGAAERTLELRDNGAVDDPGVMPVSTNLTVAASTAAHTFRFLGRKVGAAINTNVFDSTLSVVCIGG